jgi:hypothetical protein
VWNGGKFLAFIALVCFRSLHATGLSLGSLMVDVYFYSQEWLKNEDTLTPEVSDLSHHHLTFASA